MKGSERVGTGLACFNEVDVVSRHVPKILLNGGSCLVVEVTMRN